MVSLWTALVHNIYQVAAQCFYLLIIAPTCFGLSYWPCTGSSLVFYVCSLCTSLLLFQHFFSRCRNPYTEASPWYEQFYQEAQHSTNFSTWRRKPLPKCCSFYIMNQDHGQVQINIHKCVSGHNSYFIRHLIYRTLILLYNYSILF